MFYYKHKEKILFSLENCSHLSKVNEEMAKEERGILYYLTKRDPRKSRRSFALSHPSLLYLEREELNLLQKEDLTEKHLPQWVREKIEKGLVSSVNTEYPNWEESLSSFQPSSWRVHIAGLGDVGSTLLIGLRLLGGECIDSIGIFDRSPDKLKRWEYEMNQVYGPDNSPYPRVTPITEDEMFNCDIFVFCISAYVPPVGQEVKDVRMVQFEENAKIISQYAKKARQANFKGIFAVVSDPVDLLCKVVLNASNTNEEGDFDFKGLVPEQIRGYGLGVMHGRALYYAKQSPETIQYVQEGRAFGPHGEGLVIADSIERYNDEISLFLTEKARKANLEVRKTGFKPFIAPALSSGSLSLIATIKGEWHYSATYMGGVYMGARNRFTPTGTEVERLNLPSQLRDRLDATYRKLETFL